MTCSFVSALPVSADIEGSGIERPPCGPALASGPCGGTCGGDGVAERLEPSVAVLRAGCAYLEGLRRVLDAQQPRGVGRSHGKGGATGGRSADAHVRQEQLLVHLNPATGHEEARGRRGNRRAVSRANTSPRCIGARSTRPWGLGVCLGVCLDLYPEGSVGLRRGVHELVGEEEEAVLEQLAVRERPLRQVALPAATVGAKVRKRVSRATDTSWRKKDNDKEAAPWPPPGVELADRRAASAGDHPPGKRWPSQAPQPRGRWRCRSQSCRQQVSASKSCA